MTAIEVTTPSKGAGDRGDHLHRLQDRDRVTGRDRLARLDEDLRDQGRPAGPNDNAVVTGDDMGDAVDLDAEGGALLDGDDHMSAPADRDAALELAEPSTATSIGAPSWMRYVPGEVRSTRRRYSAPR